MKGERIKRIRARLDLNQAEFAGLIGVPVRTLQNCEIDRNDPTGAARSLLKLADSGI